MPAGKLRGGSGGGGWAQLELTDALYWGIIPRGLVAREQPPLPSNKTWEIFWGREATVHGLVILI